MNKGTRRLGGKRQGLKIFLFYRPDRKKGNFGLRVEVGFEMRRVAHGRLNWFLRSTFYALVR